MPVDFSLIGQKRPQKQNFSLFSRQNLYLVLGEKFLSRILVTITVLNTEREKMATTTALGSGTTNNDTGRVVQGNPSSSRFTNLSLATTASDSEKHGSPTQSSTLGNTVGISGRAFGKTRANQYIIQSFSTKIAGVTDTTFKSTASFQNPKFKKIETMKTGFLSASAWTSVSEDLPVYTHTQSAKTMSGGTDYAATTTKRLTYQTGSNTPVTTTTNY
jgi:hypothetical protein